VIKTSTAERRKRGRQIFSAGHSDRTNLKKSGDAFTSITTKGIPSTQIRKKVRKKKWEFYSPQPGEEGKKGALL